jgi:hypothetical protein
MRPGIIFIDAISKDYIKQQTRGMTEIEPGFTCRHCGSKFRVFATTNWEEENCAPFALEEDKRDVLNRAAAAISKTCSENGPEGDPKPPKGHGGGVIQLFATGNFGV